MHGALGTALGNYSSELARWNYNSELELLDIDGRI